MSVVGYISVKNKEQRRLLTGTSRGGDEKAPCLSVTVESEAPEDAGKGDSYAAISLGPIWVTRECDLLTAHLWRAHFARELLKEVRIELVRWDGEGKQEAVYASWVLTDALVRHAQSFAGDTTRGVEGARRALDRFGFEAKTTEFSVKDVIGHGDASARYERRAGGS